jgi:8-oxo-dGTP pyrophosphatase MutT (NUDIX family)
MFLLHHSRFKFFSPQIIFMDENGIFHSIEEFSRKLPKFPDGRIDYSNSDRAPVITAFVKCEDKILLLKRSKEIKNYPQKWNAVTGFMDELKPVEEKVLEEIEEELGIGKGSIVLMRIGKPYEVTDYDVKKTWIVNPVIVELKRIPEIRLNFEHTEFKWIKREELSYFNTVPFIKKFFDNYVHMKTIVFGV